jgi:hypothetical protein
MDLKTLPSLRCAANNAHGFACPDKLGHDIKLNQNLIAGEGRDHAVAFIRFRQQWQSLVALT